MIPEVSVLGTMKKQKRVSESHFNPFDLLSEEIVFSILDCLSDNPFDKKSFSLVCKSFYAIESHHRKILKPFRSEHLTKILSRYPQVTHLDLSLCPRITDGSLTVIANFCKDMLRSINLSKSKFFTHVGLSNLVMKCGNLVEIDLSNATELKDVGASVLAEAKNLERLWLVRCKSITDIGLGCIAVGCRKLRLLSLRWCLGVGDLGVGLIAVKCKEIRSLDLSYLPITNECLSSISKLQYLEDLVLEGCYGIDDDSLASLEQGCKSLEKLDMSSCQNFSHVGLSSLTSCAGCLRQLILSYGSPITPAVADSLQKLSRLQSIKLDGCQVTCSGLKAIGNWCVLLKELSLSKCLGVTDEGLCSLVTKHRGCVALAHFSPNLKQINLSYTSVTDMGLLSRASISGLQNITILHLKGLSPGGLGAALLACGGLTKVKLQTSFKSLLPQPLLEHLEAQGCVLLWRDKPFQAEVDPVYWKIQLDNSE